jgi:hypothetical protein
MGATRGWVITTSPSFTASAKAFAQKSDVKLIDGKMLKMGVFDYEPPPDLLLKPTMTDRRFPPPWTVEKIPGGVSLWTQSHLSLA